MEALCAAPPATVSRWKGRFPAPFPLELYTSSNFIGLFVEEHIAEVIKSFAADFATEAETKAGENPDPSGPLSSDLWTPDPCSLTRFFGPQTSTWSLIRSNST